MFKVPGDMKVKEYSVTRLIWHYDNGVLDKTKDRSGNRINPRPIKLWRGRGGRKCGTCFHMIRRTCIAGLVLGCVSSLVFPWFLVFFCFVCKWNIDWWFPDGFHVVSYRVERDYTTGKRRPAHGRGHVHVTKYHGTPRYFAYRKSPRIDLRTPTQKCTAYFCAYTENGDVATYRGWGLKGIPDVYIESLDIEAGSKVEVSKAGFTECNGIYVFDPSALPPRGDSIGCMQGIYKHESNPNMFIGFENGSAIGYPERNKWAIFNSEGIIYSAHTNGSGAGTSPREGKWDMAATTEQQPNGYSGEFNGQYNRFQRIAQLGSKSAAIRPPPEVHAILQAPDVGKSKIPDASCSDTIIQIDDVKANSKKVNLEKFRYNEGHNRYRIGYCILTAFFVSVFFLWGFICSAIILYGTK